MKNVSEELQEHLNSGATTMCHCWKVVRRDGIIQGFTEHDLNLTFDSVTYEAASGFSSSQMESSLGLSVDNLNVDGALSSNSISEDDLSSGKYDGAQVELFWVNFQDVSQRVLLNKGSIGRVERNELAFSAELRSQSQKLQQPTGRTYQRTCDAIFGDSRCKVDTSLFDSTGVINTVEDNRKFIVSSLSNDTDSFYSLGTMNFSSGLNSGSKFEIKDHKQGVITLWEKPPFTVEEGTTFSVIAGCDKLISTCHSKFNNSINFQGFNLIPGNDSVTVYASRDGTQEGGSIFND